MDLKSICSFIYSSFIMLLLVPGTVNRILGSSDLINSNIVADCMILIVIFMTLMLIIINIKDGIKLSYIGIGVIALISMYKISVLSGQPLSWRLSGYVLLFILISLLALKRINNMVSSQGVFWGVIFFALVNSLIGISQYLTQRTLISMTSQLDMSTITLNSDLFIFGHTGMLRAFGFSNSGMAFGTIAVLGFVLVTYQEIPISKVIRYFLAFVFALAVIASLTKNVYILFVLVIFLKYVPGFIKKYIYLLGVVVQFLAGPFAYFLQNSPYFQSDFFATFKIRYTGLIYFQNYYANTLENIIWGHGFQYDSSYKNFTALALDNQFWAIYFEGGIVLLFIVYFLIYKVAFNKSNTYHSFTSILVLFGVFGISNNYLYFFLGVAIFSTLVSSLNKMNSVDLNTKLKGGV